MKIPMDVKKPFSVSGNGAPVDVGFATEAELLPKDVILGT